MLVRHGGDSFDAFYDDFVDIYHIIRLIIPLQQSYVTAGEITVMGRLKASVRANLIYYGIAGM